MSGKKMSSDILQGALVVMVTICHSLIYRDDNTFSIYYPGLHNKVKVYTSTPILQL